MDHLLPRDAETTGVYDIAFKSATTVVDGEVVVRDVGVGSGRLERIDAPGTITAREEVPCEGLFLMPGAIDLHVHLRDPGATHKEDIITGTRAAVAGGVTTVFDMPNTNPPTTTASALADKVAAAGDKAQCRVAFFMALTARNLDEIEKASTLPGFAGVKVYLGSTTGNILVDDVRPLDIALSRVDALFAFHAELESILREHLGDVPDPEATDHHVLRPAQAVVEGARLVLDHAAVPGRRLHLCHLSAAGEVDLLARTRTASEVTCEVSPHHLRFTYEDAARLGNRLKANPPVRSAADRAALRRALADSGIDAVATDHAPHTIEEKAKPYSRAPSGVPGLDVSVPFVLGLARAGELTLARAVEVLCVNPARIAGLDDRGRIEEGLDADLALWDLNGSWTVGNDDVVSRCGWSPFEGDTLAPRPSGVWIRGRRRI